MKKDQEQVQDKQKHEQDEHEKDVQKKIDHELEDTFPASDPPSYSQPGNDDDEGNYDIKDAEN